MLFLTFYSLQNDLTPDARKNLQLKAQSWLQNAAKEAAEEAGCQRKVEADNAGYYNYLCGNNKIVFKKTNARYLSYWV